MYSYPLRFAFGIRHLIPCSHNGRALDVDLQSSTAFVHINKLGSCSCRNLIVGLKVLLTGNTSAAPSIELARHCCSCRQKTHILFSARLTNSCWTQTYHFGVGRIEQPFGKHGYDKDVYHEAAEQGEGTLDEVVVNRFFHLRVRKHYTRITDCCKLVGQRTRHFATSLVGSECMSATAPKAGRIIN